MCYNRRAVERTAKQGLSPAGPKQAAAVSPEATSQPERNLVAVKRNFSAAAENVDRLAIAQREDRLAIARQENRSAVAHQEDRSAVVREEHALLYCPVCSQRLESRRCKLLCQVCGYYMSCADYY
jgi:rubrerythrin